MILSVVNFFDKIKALPKADLHCHLDGSIRIETIYEILQRDQKHPNIKTIEQLKNALVCGEKVKNLPQFLNAFSITCDVLQKPKDIERIAFELAKDAHFENVKILEVRFCPTLMTLEGLSNEDVLRAVHLGLKKAQEKFGVYSLIIVCALRVDDPKHNAKLALEAVRFKDVFNIKGFDLAHAEKGNPAKLHQEAFAIAKEGGLNITVHAGEDDGPYSIHQAIFNLKAKRIGHGRTLIEDPWLVDHFRKSNLVVECCPSSNVQISLVKDFSSHPIRSLFDRGVCVTLNTDNRLLTNIKVSDEYMRAHQHLQFSYEELKQLAKNSIQSSFAPDDVKRSVLKSLT